ncbi:hypothetical protein BJ508DRAFT_418685 [Ascobolus immersus RN42]|uniref:Uncharacterized protein n=1 Tax=Ascobolus immersus RN42 TaxID=1160509 RepID=A0A3N4HRC1_ASCIM|nr:hypothetical protein BJ508DRAFT_418685 [Ascobolus immersus RN42]
MEAITGIDTVSYMIFANERSGEQRVCENGISHDKFFQRNPPHCPAFDANATDVESNHFITREHSEATLRFETCVCRSHRCNIISTVSCIPSGSDFCTRAT